MVFTILYFILIYLYFKNLLNKNHQFIIKRIIVFISLICVFLFFVVTIYRFSSDRYSDYNLLEWITRYIGESMPNFNSEGWYFRDTANGRSSFAFFNSIVGGQGVRDLDYLHSITGVRMNVYYTMFGDLMIDFGRFPTFLIVLFIYFLAKSCKPQHGVLKLENLILFSIFSYMFLAGYFVYPLMNRIYSLITSLIVYLLLLMTSKKIKF